MRPSFRPIQIATAVFAGALLAGGGYAIGAGGHGATIHGCVTRDTHQLLIQSRCSRGERALQWNEQGPQGVTGPPGPAAAAAWATVVPGVSGPIVLNSDNLTVAQDGSGVFTLTAGGPCTSGEDAEVVTPSDAAVNTIGVPVAYVVTPNGPPNVFKVVTGGISSSGAFTQENGDFSVAVYCKQT